MPEQKRLTLTLSVELTVPRTGVDFNNLISAFQQLSKLGLVPLFEATLQAIEQEAGDYLKAEEPKRFVWHGVESKTPKRWRTPFGEVRHRYRRMKDRLKGDTFSPLREALMIPARKQLTWPLLVGPVGLASELSFRKATREARRLGEDVGPSKSSTWVYFQAFSEGGLDPRKAEAGRTLEVVIADGTKLKRQERGWSRGRTDLRIVLSQRRDGTGLQVVAFDVGKTWRQLKERLRKDFPGEAIEAILTDGEERIEDLADPGTIIQRCLVHGPRGLDRAMYKDGLSKRHRDWIVAQYRDAKAWCVDKAALESLSECRRGDLLDLVEQADAVCKKLLDWLPPAAAHARYYLHRFGRNALSYLRTLLNRDPPLPVVNTNAIENVFSQMDIRLKRIGRRWSDKGVVNMIRVLLAKALNSKHWQEYLDLFRTSPGAIEVKCWVHPGTWSYS